MSTACEGLATWPWTWAQAEELQTLRPFCSQQEPSPSSLPRAFP